MKAVVAAFNQEKALVGAFSVITNLRMDRFEALVTVSPVQVLLGVMPEAGADLRPPQHGLHPPQPPLQPPLHHRLLRHRPQHQHSQPQVMKVSQYLEKA